MDILSETSIQQNQETSQVVYVSEAQNKTRKANTSKKH